MLINTTALVSHFNWGGCVVLRSTSNGSLADWKRLFEDNGTITTEVLEKEA